MNTRQSKEALDVLFDIVCSREHTNSEHNYYLKLYNAIMDDLNALEIIANSLVIENKPFKLREKNADESYISYCLSQSYEIHQYNLNEKLRKALTQWIINNIDKEKVKEWLKENKQ